MKFEDYERLGKFLKETRQIMFTFKHVKPKSARINQYHRRAINHIDYVRNYLEEMLKREHPDKFTTEVFY
jgi:hypothetical protein